MRQKKEEFHARFSLFPFSFLTKLFVFAAKRKNFTIVLVRSCMKFCEKKVEKNREWGEQNTQKELALSSRSPPR